MIYPIEGKCDKKILIVNYKRDLWAKFSVFNCIDNGRKNYDVRRKSIWNAIFSLSFRIEKKILAKEDL